MVIQKDISLTRFCLPLVGLNITIIYSKGYCKNAEPFYFSIITVTLVLFYSYHCWIFPDSNNYCIYTVRFVVNRQLLFTVILFRPCSSPLFVTPCGLGPYFPDPPPRVTTSVQSHSLRMGYSGLSESCFFTLCQFNVQRSSIVFPTTQYFCVQPAGPLRPGCLHLQGLGPLRYCNLMPYSWLSCM